MKYFAISNMVDRPQTGHECGLNSQKIVASSFKHREKEWTSNFVYVQDIALQHREQEPEFEPTETQLNTLLQLADDDHPYSGYAKSVYYSLTGIVLTTELQIPESSLGKVSSVNSTGVISEKISVYPNPFSQELRISVPGSLDLTHVSIEVYDALGRRVVSRYDVKEKLTLNTTLWNEGAYIVLVKNEGEIIDSRKTILAK